ncbi:MAG: Xaa-Pro aminopeptidase, partial [Gemmatimonadota bacterium]|nr:Xaa-Pro aminopeptidase [Gemmatimonadota bacterium]
MKPIPVVLALVLAAAPLAGQAPAHVPEATPARHHPLPTVRRQAEEMQGWVEARLTRVLPALMAEYDADMWILSMREYGEDPVFWSMISPTTFAARRRSIYVFTRGDDGSVERL